jgi:hypothetical protein
MCDAYSVMYISSNAHRTRVGSCPIVVDVTTTLKLRARGLRAELFEMRIASRLFAVAHLG